VRLTARLHHLHFRFGCDGRHRLRVRVTPTCRDDSRPVRRKLLGHDCAGFRVDEGFNTPQTHRTEHIMHLTTRRIDGVLVGVHFVSLL
jgi:hypothetical protein